MHIHFPAQELREEFDQGQSETCAFKAPGEAGVQLDEGLEETWKILLLDAYAGIPDCDRHLLMNLAASNFNPNFAVFTSEFGGIVQQA